MEEWDKGVAFVRGINMYGKHRITKREMMELCRKVENENLKILKIFKTDNIVFKKKNMHYAKVGSEIERVLSSHFGSKIYVTTRSVKTIERLI